MKILSDKRNIIIILLIFSIIAMSIGYLNLSSVVGIESPKGENQKLWDIKITDFKKINSIGNVREILSPSHTNETATFNVEFSEDKSYIEYIIKIKNSGSIDAKLKSIDSSFKEKNINVQITDLYVGSNLRSGEEASAKVKVSYDKYESEVKKCIGTIIFNYVQA